MGGKPKVIGLRDFPIIRDRLRIDKHLAAALKEEIEQYDGGIGWNSALFDWPLLNDRLMLTGSRALEKRFHIDIMYAARMGKSTLTSSRLDWVAKALGCPYKKTALDLSTWKLAEAEAVNGFRHGSENYDYIVDHCREDIRVTEWVYERLKHRVQSISKR